MSQKSAVKPDPRVRRTQKLLRDAFLALVLEHGFEAVRVIEIIARAEVNRATFYHHYRSKRDLLRSWTQEVGTLLDTGAVSLEDPRVNAGSDEYLPAVVVSIFEHIATHASYYRLMLGRHGLGSIASAAQWIEADITRPNGALPTQVDVWHDRAVFHFLTRTSDR